MLQIRGVLEGSEAAAAVLREGDLIVSIDGVPTEAPLGFGEAVQALHGPIDSEGEFVGSPQEVPLVCTAPGVFEADYQVGEAGPYGVTVRAMPSHPHLISPVELGIIAWAH